MSDQNLDTEWLEALEVEPPTTEQKAADDKLEADKVAEEKEITDAAEAKVEADEKEADEKARENETDEQKTERETKEAADKVVVPDERANAKSLIKEALAELQTDSTIRDTTYEGLKSEVSKTLYPEGIDRQLRDSDGDPITGIDDLVKLVNPKTNELFTDEEAGSWLLSAQQQLNKDVETVEGFIADVAETNQSLQEGAARVAVKYGALLSADQDLKNQLLQAYNETIIKDPNTGIAIKLKMDVERFFDLTLGPRAAQEAATAEKAVTDAAEAKVAKAKADKLAQGERGDLRFSGKSDNMSESDKEWATAYKNYEEGV